MKSALIVSLKFRVSHIAHLIASYKQFEELGYASTLLINKDMIPFVPKGIKYYESFHEIKACDVAIFWFPAIQNIRLIENLKKTFKSKILYVFHEPIENFKTYKKAHLSLSQIAKTYLTYLAQLIIVRTSSVIILPSQKAHLLYEKSIARKINSDYILIPLLFSDDSSNYCEKKEYFSYIGTIAQDHAYKEYVDFIIKASKDTDIPSSINFLIATKNKVEITSELKEILTSGRLKVIDSHPLSEDEINVCYASSLAVWNAYHRTTQSGVLAKASMFGTPAIVCRHNLSEFSIDGENVVAISNNKDYLQIKEAFLKIINNYDFFSKNSKNIFNQLFNYKSQNKKLSSIL